MACAGHGNTKVATNRSVLSGSRARQIGRRQRGRAPSQTQKQTSVRVTFLCLETESIQAMTKEAVLFSARLLHSPQRPPRSRFRLAHFGESALGHEPSDNSRRRT